MTAWGQVWYTYLMPKHGRRASARTSQATTKARDTIVPSLRSYVPYAVTGITNANAFPLTVVEAAGISAVRRCVTLIANAVARGRWTEWQDGERLDPPSRIVQRPAAVMTRREFVWRCVAGMALDDIVYVRMIGGVDDGGMPGSLIPLPKEVIQPAGFIDPYGIFPPTQYTISGVPGVVSGEEVIQLRSAFWPGVPPHLAGILQMARQTLMQAWSQDAYLTRYWQQGGSPTTVITTDQELTNPQADAIGERWREKRQKGPDYPAVLGKGAKAAEWGASGLGRDIAESRQQVIMDVANLFGVPHHYVGVVPSGSSQTYANLNDEALSLDRFTLNGFYQPIEDMVTDLLPDGHEMLIDMSELTKNDMESRFRSWAMALGQKPWITPEEVRTLERLPKNEDIEAMTEAQVLGMKNAAEAQSISRANGGQPVEKPQREEVPA